MPTVTRSRIVDAPGERVWDVVSDPHSFPRWWPDVQRVEDASPMAWTKVMTTPRGKVVRADFSRERAVEPTEVAWRQELEETPFEGLLKEAVTTVSIEPAEGGSRVQIEQRQRLRGMARFGGFFFRRATRRKLDEALAALEGTV
jgi:uncharacterized protein YndB with AHSA1/START domain